MAAHSLDNLLQRWGLDQLTTEQAIGQILQILRDFEPRILRLEQTVTASPRVTASPATPPPTPAPTPTATNPRKRQARRRAR